MVAVPVITHRPAFSKTKILKKSTRLCKKIRFAPEQCHDHACYGTTDSDRLTVFSKIKILKKSTQLYKK